VPNLSECAEGEGLLRPVQVRRLLGICPTTLWNYGKDGLLRPAQHTAGGHARYRESDVAAFMATLAVAA